MSRLLTPLFPHRRAEMDKHILATGLKPVAADLARELEGMVADQQRMFLALSALEAVLGGLYVRIDRLEAELSALAAETRSLKVEDSGEPEDLAIDQT
ncbi:hypothetical protein SAE02_61590 [Skermanella aerolata]|uniref:Uncharacterized protein n=1 Tax=Skermanella aerolata TaxID=393310 RepID=A0A512DZW3_9PROT|nr:hypothetical protein [Skermanella aerolata]KJB91882.1 hypothetical protein N826_25535 [Skermanella aerolata KACC 11604]GEO42011.1 hypothetical protein SAE02_61590 [Skermanella aerolata]